MVTFKGGWSKLYYTQHTLLSNMRQLRILFFEKQTHADTHTQKGEVQGIILRGSLHFFFPLSSNVGNKVPILIFSFVFIKNKFIYH